MRRPVLGLLLTCSLLTFGACGRRDTEPARAKTPDEEAVAAILALDPQASIHHDEKSPGKVGSVSFYAITEEGMARLKEMPDLAALSFAHSKVTDAGLAHLRDLPNLHWLDLSYTEVTDAGLVHLEGMSTLRDLNLYQTKVTARGHSRLRKALPNLRVVPRKM